MKRPTLCLALLLSILCLCACTPTYADQTSIAPSAPSVVLESSEPEAISSEEEPVAYGWYWQEKIEATEVGQVDDDVDVPRIFPEADVAAPDFLDSELQSLYRQARNIAYYLAVSPPDFDYAVGLMEGQEEFDVGYIVDYNGYSYCVANGRFRNWDDAEALVLSIFTQECFDALNGKGESPTAMVSINGRLGLHNGGRGTNYEYAAVPDEFLSVESTEDEIVFTLIGHYLEIEDDMDAWSEKYKAGEFTSTTEYTIRLVNTEEGWRFDEFHIPL